jgi:glucose-6-phosphate-specific signal transduction histidine kinase
VAQAYIDEIERIRQFEVRNVSQQLAPEFAGPYFSPALNNLVTRYAKVMKINLDINEHGQLPETLRLACYRIVEQALLNAATHAAATEVTVHVREHVHELSIRVINNGKGLVQKPVAGAGFATIDEWVSQHSGTWKLGTVEEKTELSVSLYF